MSRARDFAVVQPWLSLVVRLTMAGILIFAGIPKLLDIPQSIRAVRAYQALPETLVPFVGTMLPFLELSLALLLLLGIFTRFSAIVWLLMMVGFTSSLLYAWSQGLDIDCGCFGSGGEVAPEETNYPRYLAERIAFIGLGTFLAIWPRSRFSVDAVIAPAVVDSRTED